MKKITLLLFLLLTGFIRNLEAGNTLGTELSYRNLAPNVYEVTFMYVRDCNFSPVPPFVDLQLDSRRCLAGRSMRLIQSTQPQGFIPIYFYCRNGSLPCSQIGSIGPEITRYSGVLTFSAAEMACLNWYLSVDLTQDSLSATANITGTPTLKTEAFITLKPGIYNNTGEAADGNNLFIPAIENQFYAYPSRNYDRDYDSVAYSFFQPRLPNGTPVPYAAGYTHQNPVPSQPALSLDPASGSISLRPTSFTPPALAVPGANRYLVGMQFTEYRKINGRPIMVGYNQRHFTIQVENTKSVGNIPSLTDFKVNGNLVDMSKPYYVPAGQTVLVEFQTFDADTADRVYVTATYPVANASPATITSNPSPKQPIFRFTWTPDSKDARSAPYGFNFEIRDNSCPRAAVPVNKFEMIVTAPLGQEKAAPPPTVFSVFPNPFSSEVSFKIGPAAGEQTLLIYNALGKEIDRLEINGRNSGPKTIRWENAERFAAGTYIAKLIGAGQSVQTLKFTKLP